MYYHAIPEDVKEQYRYHINKVNEAVELIYSIDKAFSQLEKEQARNIECPCCS
jgi:hypothetical protein